MIKGITILSRDGKHKGHYTGGVRPCQMEGCRGSRMAIRWDDGKLTYPCSTLTKAISSTTHKIM